MHPTQHHESWIMDSVQQAPRVDFYLLQTSTPTAIGRFACRLTEKAFKAGHSVYLCTQSAEQTHYLDDLLWCFREDSFVPHAPYDGMGSNCSKLVQIGHNPEKAPDFSVLINLTEKIPIFFNKFYRVTEIVSQDEDNRQVKRNNYKRYKASGCSLHMHKIQSI